MNVNKIYLVMLGLPLLLCGCVTEPTQTEASFGDSVRQMIQAQTHDPSTLTNPSEESVEGADGQRAESVLEAYRSGVTKPDPAGSNPVLTIEGAR